MRAEPAWPTDSELIALLAPFVREALDRDTSMICALTEEDRIAYVNPAWKRFGHENGGARDGTWGVGTLLRDVVPPVLRPFYDSLFATVRSTNAHAEYSYDCSSPTSPRLFHTRIFPTQRGGLLIVHSPSLEAAPSEPAKPAIEGLYRDANELVTQCANCRRMRRVGVSPEQWDWVPEYAERMLPNTSHGLCAVCFAYYYAEWQGEERRPRE
jgi:hypothetical protein